MMRSPHWMCPVCIRSSDWFSRAPLLAIGGLGIRVGGVVVAVLEAGLDVLHQVGEHPVLTVVVVGDRSAVLAIETGCPSIRLVELGDWFVFVRAIHCLLPFSVGVVGGRWAVRKRGRRYARAGRGQVHPAK